MSMFEENKENQHGGFHNSKRLNDARGQKSFSDDIPTLVCGICPEPVWIGFGCVNIGTKTTRQFTIVNPKDYSIKLVVQKCPTRKGFTINLGNEETVSTLQPGESLSGYIHWIPSENMSVREVASILVNGDMSLHFTLHGISGIGQSVGPTKRAGNEGKKKREPRKSIFQTAANNKDDSSSHKVKKCDPLPPPNPVTATTQRPGSGINQEATSMRQWINYKFSEVACSLDMLEVSGTSSAYHGIERRRLEEKYRGALEGLLEREDVAAAVYNIEEEIRSERMCIRSDQNVRANVGLRDELMGLLFSYDLQWLRLGLEVVLGVPISPLCPTPTEQTAPHLSRERIAELWRGGIKRVMQSHLFQCEELRAMHFVEGVPVTPAVEKKYHTDVCKHILRTFLVLVLLLDQARTSGVCGHRTALFVSREGGTSDIKSSKDLLIAFCKSFLKAERNVIKHLATLQYSVSFIQSYYDEFDFTVRDVSIDFRDGVRLCYLMNLLVYTSDRISAGDKADRPAPPPLVDPTRLRIPAISRLQKLHNVTLVMNSVRSTLGTDMPFPDKCIVDGQMPATLSLLWTMLFEFEAKFATSAENVRAETEKILKSVNQTLHRSLEKKGEVLPHVHLRDELKQWYAAIASTYQLSTQFEHLSFTEDLCDGSILCLVIHFYHPTLIPADIIQSIHAEGVNTANGTSLLSVNIKNTARKNFNAVKHACDQLGGISSMIPTADTVHDFDEKYLVVFLCILFARLMDTSAKWKAAVAIQKVFRNSPKKKKCTMSLPPSLPVPSCFLYSRHDAARIITSFMHTVVVEKASNTHKRVSCLSAKDSTDVDNESVQDMTSVHCEESKSVSDVDSLVVEFTQLDTASTACLDVQSTEEPASSPVHEDVPDKSSTPTTELPSIVVLATHAAAMAQIRSKHACIPLPQEQADTSHTEAMIAHMKAAHEIALREAEVMKQDLEAKLAFEISEKSRICCEYERRAEEQRLRDAEEKRMQEELYAQRLLAVSRIQNAWRVCRQRIAVAKRRCRLRSGLVLAQALYRGRQVRRRQETFVRGVLLAQRIYRDRLVKQRLDAAELSARNTMLKFFRLSMAKLRQRRHDVAATTLQSMWRGSRGKSEYLLTRNASIRVQTFFRQRYAERQFKKILQSTVCVQQAVRVYFVRLRVLKMVSAQLIQRRWKKYNELRQSRNLDQHNAELTLFINTRAAAVISKFLRSCLCKIKARIAAKKLASWFLLWRPLMRARKMNRGFHRLQALRRSILVRRKQPPVVRNCLQRLNAAHERSNACPEMRLGRQTEVALRALQSGKMISHVLRACQTLETCTAFSQVCCKNFVVSSASNILFSLIRSCNRSTPHQELLRCALVVLLNVTKDCSLASELSHNGDTTELLVDLMQMFRDKKIIFNLSCDLLTRLVMAQQSIKFECRSDEMKKRLDGILHILERKHRLDQKVKTINTATRSKKLSPSGSVLPDVVAPYELMVRLMVAICD